MMSTEGEIKAAVEKARRKDPSIPEGYATAAIAQGKSVSQVKGDLFDRLTAMTPRAKSKADMLAQVGQMNAGPDTFEARGASMRRTLRNMGRGPNDAA